MPKSETLTEDLNRFLNFPNKELREMAQLSQISESVSSSYQKIEEVFEKKEIDVNKMVKLKILAVFKPEFLLHKNQHEEILTKIAQSL